MNKFCVNYKKLRENGEKMWEKCEKLGENCENVVRIFSEFSCIFSQFSRIFLNFSQFFPNFPKGNVENNKEIIVICKLLVVIRPIRQQRINYDTANDAIIYYRFHNDAPPHWLPKN